MKKRVAVGAFLLAALVVVALFYYVPSPGRGRPGDAAKPVDANPAQGKAVEPGAPTPGAAPAQSPGPRAEFSEPVPRARPPAAAPEARRRRAERMPPRAEEGRSGTAPRVQVRPTVPRLAGYFRTLSAEIGGRWHLPESVARRAATIPIVLKVARDGRVLWALVEGSSGDPAIDDSVARMIEDLKRDGLPPLPDQYPYDELDIGLVLNTAGVS